MGAMEADWEFEIGPDAPVIDGVWDGYADLRKDPESASNLPETEKLPELGTALAQLNGYGSPVWTARCDVWTPDEFDADEMEAPQDSSNVALASYIDLLLAADEPWSRMDAVAEWCRRLCARLRDIPLRECRVDLVVRSAFLTAERQGLGVTAYLQGCGTDAAAASRALSAALGAFANAVCEAQS